MMTPISHMWLSPEPSKASTYTRISQPFSRLNGRQPSDSTNQRLGLRNISKATGAACPTSFRRIVTTVLCHTGLYPGFDDPSPHQKRRLEGDRVKTNHGVGTVIEIEGEKYLIDLDGQSAKLWQTAWAMKKA